MKVLSLLPLALAASAFVIPDTETIDSLTIEDPTQNQESHPFWDNIKDPKRIWEEIEQKFDEAVERTTGAFSDAVDYAHDTVVDYTEDFQSAFAGQAWLEDFKEDQPVPLIDDEHHPPHHGPPPPHHGPPHPPHHGPCPPHKRPHKRPHHPPHHHKSNKTVYELIAESKYTTKLAKAISEFPDLVELLNGTTANFTVFAPTDRAFAKIPKHAPKPPKEFLKKLLTYHVSPEFYPAGRILVSRTLPSALKAEFIGDYPQRITSQIGFRGLTINFYARIIAVNIFGSNGVIHGLDSILLPPPKVVDIISLLPTEFSTLELGLVKTGLFELMNKTELHEGGTLFAPSNFAFKLLGPRINAFLFSKYGEKYLKALLLYHTVPNITLYSDAIYKADEESTGHHRIPKGKYHIDLPTGLEGKTLAVDVLRFGRLIDVRINGFIDASVLDGAAADGVIHVVPTVLIPPKEPGAAAESAEGMTLEEFQERLEPYVEAEDEFMEWEL